MRIDRHAKHTYIHTYIHDEAKCRFSQILRRRLKMGDVITISELSYSKPLISWHIRICIAFPNDFPRCTTIPTFPLYISMQIHGLCYSLVVDLTPHDARVQRDGSEPNKQQSNSTKWLRATTRCHSRM